MSRADDALARLDVVPSKPVVTEVVATTEPATLPHFVLLDVETDQPSLDTGNRRHTHERRLFRGSHPASCITRRSPRASFSSSAVSGGTIPSVSRVNLASIAHHRQSSGLSYVLSTGGCLDDLEGGFTNRRAAAFRTPASSSPWMKPRSRPDLGASSSWITTKEGKPGAAQVCCRAGRSPVTELTRARGPGGADLV